MSFSTSPFLDLSFQCSLRVLAVEKAEDLAVVPVLAGILRVGSTVFQLRRQLVVELRLLIFTGVR